MSEPSYRRLHPATIGIEFARFISKFAYAIVLFVVLTVMRGESDWSELPFAALGILSVGGAFLRYWNTRFAITGNSLVIRSGWVQKQIRTIPLDRIQNVNVTRTILHRLLGVADLKIETAASGVAEGYLSALSVSDAEHLKAELTGQVQASTTAFELPEDIPLYRASLKELLLAGASQNRMGAIIGSLIGIFVFFRGDAFEDLFRWLGRFAPSDWQAYAVVFLLLAFGGWLLSIATSVFSYYNFKLTLENGKLHRSYGLATHVENVLPLKRVQMLRIEQSLIQRLIRRGSLVAETAGSLITGSSEQAPLSGSSVLTPLTSVEDLDRLVQIVFPEVRVRDIAWKPQHIAAFWRGVIAPLVIWSTFVVTLAVWKGQGWLWLFPVVWIYAIWSSWRRYRALGYASDEEFLYARSGLLTRRIAVLPRVRIQSAEIEQGPIQRKLGSASLQLATISFATKSNFHTVDLPLEVAEELASNLSTQKREALKQTFAVLTPAAESPV